MKYCPNCGNELKTGENFCGGCGTKIGTDTVNQPVKKKGGLPVWAIILIVLGFFIFIGAFASSTPTAQEGDLNNSDGSSTTTTVQAQPDNKEKQTTEKKDTKTQEATTTTAANSKFTYSISKQYKDKYGFSYYIEGLVKNNTNKDYSYIQIEFVCYDKNGNNLGTALDNLNNLLGGQTWKFKAMYFGSNAEEVHHCDYHEITSW